jgi:RsiW-degrading membrane proteinase PrsW (M82 family)/RNA polymerase subunit RPABC4/transcription elongation factor Spt4
MSSPYQVPTTDCRVCKTDVPAGAFCGFCGSHLTSKRGDGPPWLRLRAYGAAPGEHVLRPSVASSLFPHLHHRSRAPFRVGLIILLIALVTFAVLRWQAPLVAVSALGLPLLFHLYLYEADAYHDLPGRALVLIAVLSACLGVGWARLTDEIIARSYAVAFQTAMEFKQPLADGVIVPVSGAIVMIVPIALARLSRVGTRESLDGFLIGAVAAMSFTAAATLTRLAPQFATGLMASHRPIVGLVAEAGIRGVAMSLVAATAGGMVGAALWFTRPDPAHQHEGQWLASPLPAVTVVLIAYAALGLTDASPLAETWQLLVYLTVALLMVVALRLVLHMALLREAHDPITQEPLLCEDCGHVVPDMAFCPACGVATRAASRSSRAARRGARPVLVEPPPEGT